MLARERWQTFENSWKKAQYLMNTLYVTANAATTAGASTAAAITAAANTVAVTTSATK